MTESKLNFNFVLTSEIGSLLGVSKLVRIDGSARMVANGETTIEDCSFLFDVKYGNWLIVYGLEGEHSLSKFGNGCGGVVDDEEGLVKASWRIGGLTGGIWSILWRDADRFTAIASLITYFFTLSLNRKFNSEVNTNLFSDEPSTLVVQWSYECTKHSLWVH